MPIRFRKYPGRFRNRLGLMRSRLAFKSRRFSRMRRMMSRRRAKTEIKYAEGFNFSGGQAGNSFVSYEANPLIPQGTSKAERIGNKIKTRYYTITTWFESTNTAQTNPQGLYRFILYSPKVLQSQATTFMSQLGFDRNWDTHIVQVYMDKTFYLINPPIIGGLINDPNVQGRNTLVIKKILKFPRTITYAQGLSDVATEPIDTLFAILLSPVPLNPNINWSFRYKLSFIDV